MAGADLTGDIVVKAPPEVPRPATPGLVLRLLPVVMSVAAAGAMAAAYFSGSASSPAAVRNPTFLAFPLMMAGSVLVTALPGHGRRGPAINADRAEYFGYLCDLRKRVTQTAAAQITSLNHRHPDPDTLWTLIGGPRVWERRPGDADFRVVRVGRGTRPLTTRLVAPKGAPMERSDPVTTAALNRFLHTHSTVTDVPIVIPLHGGGLEIDGDPADVRGLLRAMICQLAVWRDPDRLLIVAAVTEGNRAQWDWLKWLPHNQHPTAIDALGSARLVYGTLAEAYSAAAQERADVVVIADTGERGAGTAIDGVTTIQLGSGSAGEPLVIRGPNQAEKVAHPDHLSLSDALVFARRLAGHQVRGVARGLGDWASLTGIGDVSVFDPIPLWCSLSRAETLRVAIGSADDGTALELDIKEPAENGMGPHGLCIGATGSGKSELLRTVAVGMMARNSPEVLNLLLVDFKGGATFLGLASAPHVSAVITNLADDAPRVARMRDALAGEMNRRQHLLRTAGNFVGLAAYERARRAGRPLPALPTLFIIVDEFSELLSQQPDFADLFVAIGRLGRSLGMHLLLASQRLDEGRLRGLEAHLSYRICLKTLSASESRAVVGTTAAYELPNTPGVALLRDATGQLVRFHVAFVSGRTGAGRCEVLAPQFFTWDAVTCGHSGAGESSSTVMQTVLDRLAGHGPAAHQVWLPPLGMAPALDNLLHEAALTSPDLAAPIGIVDRPFEQARTPLTIELGGAAGHVAVVGAPRSGKSTALCTLITALAATHDPGRVQFYCLDFGGGELASLRELPHVGAVAGRAEPQLVERIVTELESLLRTRESSPGAADVFLVIDGWASLRHEFEILEQPITAFAAQGLSFGMHVVLSASRWAEIRPSLRDQIGTRIELRLGDPADSELDRRQAQQVPRDKPGRGLSREGLHMMMALPLATADLVGRHGQVKAPPILLLPNCVEYDTVLGEAREEFDGSILFGLEERRLQPVALDFECHLHLLILGDNYCGKTAALRTVCREIIRTTTASQAQLVIVDLRRALLGVVESRHLGGYVMSPPTLDALLPDLVELLRGRIPPPNVGQQQLRARSWWSGPDIYVVVDDYDLVAGRLTALVDYLPHARDVGLHFVVARRSGGAARALFDPLLAGLRDLGCMTLLMNGSLDEAGVFGAERSAPLPPGRGTLTARAGDEQVVQVAWSLP